MIPSFGRTSKVLLTSAALAATFVFVLTLRLRAELGQADLRSEAEAYHLPNPAALRLLSIGYNEFAADLLFLRAIVYFGEHFTTDTDYRWLDNYIEAIAAADPHFRRVYEWAGVVTMYNRRGIDNAAVAASTRFLEMGYDRFPTHWVFPFEIGFNYYFELKTDDPKLKESWQRKGMWYFLAASRLSGAPPWLALLAASTFDRHGERAIAIHHLKEVLAGSDDPKFRADVLERLADLESEETAVALERANAAFRRLHERVLPYAPDHLLAIAGDRRLFDYRPVAELTEEALGASLSLDADSEPLP